jgi:hypothetical protein
VRPVRPARRELVDQAMPTSRVNLVQNTSTPVGSLSLPAGTYVVWAKGMANNNDASDISLTCSLSGGTGNTDTMSGEPLTVGAGDDREFILMSMGTSFAAAGNMTVACTSTAVSSNIIRLNITAIQVENLTVTAL